MIFSWFQSYFYPVEFSPSGCKDVNDDTDWIPIVASHAHATTTTKALTEPFLDTEECSMCEDEKEIRRKLHKSTQKKQRRRRSRK